MSNDTRALSVGVLIDERPLSRFQIRVFALCGLIMLLDGFDALCVGFLAPAMVDDLGVPLRTFGPVFAASLFGQMVAGMAGGLIADRWGRKWVIVISTLTFGSFSIMTARGTSIEELVLWRFLTGLGLGGAMSNVVALASEYTPKRRQVAKLVSECSLREYGNERGLGVFAGGRFYEFDKRGNELAKLALEKAGKDKVATFKVVGRLVTTTVDRASIPGPHGSAIKVVGQETARKMRVESIEEVN